MEGQYMTFPNQELSFYIKPKNKDAETVKFVNSLIVVRFYIEPIVDFNIHGPSPVDNVPIFGTFYGLNMDKCQHITSQYQYSSLQDTISWFIYNVNW